LTARTARFVSRTILGLALGMTALTAVVAVSTWGRVQAGQIVVVPPDRLDEIVAGLPAMNANCEGPAPSRSLADASAVLCLMEAMKADGATFGPNVAFLAAGTTLGLIWLLTGSVIVSRQPRNAAGWVFHVVGAGLLATALAPTVVVAGVKSTPGSIPAVWLFALGAEYGFGVIGLLPLLWLIFPDGRTPSSRWRWPVRVYVGAVALAVASAAFSPGPLNNLVDVGIIYLNPLGIPSLAGIAGLLQAAGVLTALVISVATVIGVRGRYRRARDVERQQLRWLRFVTTIALISLTLMFVGGNLLAILISDPPPLVQHWWPFWFFVTALAIGAGVPAAYVIAILRHGLWGLDVVIKKTVQYVVVVTVMALIAVVAVVAIPTLVLGSAADTGFVGVVALAALLAAAFIWIRGPARRLASRLVYGHRATPYEVLSDFGTRVGSTYSMEDVLPRMAQLVAEATGARRVDVWLRVGSTLRPEATFPEGAPARPSRSVHGDRTGDGTSEFFAPVQHQGDMLGAITVEQPPDDPMNPAREGLVRDVAAQAGLVLRNAGLIAELRASRQRLVAAQDDERRKIERNLHDGAQQQLVALGLQLKAARAVLDRDPARAGQMLDTISQIAGDALDDLRDLARGIYPPLLADQGLGAALESQARKAALPVTVTTRGLDRYPQEVEAAVYFCTLEALNNVAKYAGASHAVVTLAEQDGHVSFAVTDDGRGFDTDQTDYGTGLQGMADRLDAIGGLFHVTSSPGEGTTVSGRIPIGANRHTPPHPEP
jgi:signal transduction histidine kinase